MPNNWKEIWERHDASIDGDEDFETLLMKLKRANGFDAVGRDAISFEAWMKHIRSISHMLGPNINSIYEVGCGSGANLIMFQRLGVTKVGGLDYSPSLSRAAAKVTGSNDIFCGEADSLSVTSKYDAVISDSVTQYLPSLDYANRVFEKMIQKANRVIAILDVHDAEKRVEWLAQRKKIIRHYDAEYSSLDERKLFINRGYFLENAKKHGLHLEFSDTGIDNYWNSQFTYSVFIYK